MSWKKHMSIVPSPGLLSKQAQSGGIFNFNRGNDTKVAAASRTLSILPEVYAGPATRIERYNQYDIMDMDADVNSALDTLADFCTQNEDVDDLPFRINFHDGISDTEMSAIMKCLKDWTEQNEFNRRIWRIFRSTLKYGDQFFIRDPETQIWYWIDPRNIQSVKVDVHSGRVPISYMVRQLDLNMDAKVGTRINQAPNQLTTNFNSMPTPYSGLANSTVYGGNQPYTMSGTGGEPQSPATLGNTNYGSPSTTMNNAGMGTLTEVDAKHMIHLSLSEGMDGNWPFGLSILEQVYKVFKQKDLLEDAMIIYRVQRAPERRIFKVDVGDAPPHKAREQLERIKAEADQRKMPSRTGGSNILDTTYNPLCLDMETKIPLLDGRILSLTELTEEYHQGKENWTYSISPETGMVVPGNITWAGITKKDARVITLKLSNGKTITLTADHKIPVKGKGYIQANKLMSNDILFEFSTNVKHFWNSKEKDWQLINKMVVEFFRSREKSQEIHFSTDKNHNEVRDNVLHADFNLDNNYPSNLYGLSEQAFVAINTLRDSLLLNGVITNNEEWLDIKAELGSAWKLLPVDKKAIISNQKVMPSFKPINIIDEVTVLEIINTDTIMDVGTLTIDGREAWHGFHNFATDAGIFVKNSMMDDFFFAVTADGRGSSVDVLPGGQSNGNADEVKYFKNALMRGLRIPLAYLPTGPEDANIAFTDGRVGTAYIQEFRFGKYCSRLQSLISKIFDTSFKEFILAKGVNVDNRGFDLMFHKPENFGRYRQVELDTAQLSVLGNLLDVPWLSKQFIMERYMQLTPLEMARNRELWLQENPDNGHSQAPGAPKLGDIGISGGGLGGGMGGGIPGMPDEGEANLDLPLGNEPTEPAGGEGIPAAPGGSPGPATPPSPAGGLVR